MGQYLLGIDLGAGSLKASVIDARGVMLGEVSQPIATMVPQSGWSEQDPAAWWAALCAAVPGALRQAGVAPGALAGIGVSAGAHIPVLTGADGAVLRPAIMWNDQRSAEQAAALHARAGEMIIGTSLNRVNPTWTLAMLDWVRAHEPDLFARTRRLYLAKDYLRFCLTGTWETDFSDAVGALMADVNTGGWSPAICALIGWDMARLPPIRRPADVVGGVSARAAAMTGLAAGTPVVCGSNDTTVEFFGLGAIRPGMAAVKLATAGVLYQAVQGPRVQPPVSCYPHIIEGMFYTATGTNSCASAHRWLRDIMFAQGGFEEMDALAGGVAPGAAGLLFHPYLQGERAPYWDPLLRGDFIGLTISHTRAHFARALYEGLAFSIRDLMGQMAGAGFDTIRLIGGGARSAVWRRIIADVTGLRVQQMAAGDASFGAALVAGVGVGVFGSPEAAVAACVRVVDETSPDAAAGAVYDGMFGIYKEAQVRLAGISHRIQGVVG